jgi:hypothetical protein
MTDTADLLLLRQTRSTGGSARDTTAVEVAVTLVIAPGRMTMVIRLRVEGSAMKLKVAAGSHPRNHLRTHVENSRTEDSLSPDDNQGHTAEMGLNLHRSGTVQTGIARAVQIIINIMRRPCRHRTMVSRSLSRRNHLSTHHRLHRSICQVNFKASPRSQCRHSEFHRLPHRSSRDSKAASFLLHPPISTVCGPLLRRRPTTTVYGRLLFLRT